MVGTNLVRCKSFQLHFMCQIPVLKFGSSLPSFSNLRFCIAFTSLTIWETECKPIQRGYVVCIRILLEFLHSVLNFNLSVAVVFREQDLLIFAFSLTKYSLVKRLSLFCLCLIASFVFQVPFFHAPKSVLLSSVLQNLILCLISIALFGNFRVPF